MRLPLRLLFDLVAFGLLIAPTEIEFEHERHITDLLRSWDMRHL